MFSYTKIITRLLLVFSLTLVLPGYIFAATYYVDGGMANDTGNGTSWATAKKYIYSGIQIMSGGDTLIVRAGTYTGDNNRIRGIPSGSAGSPTVVKAETDFGVILTGLNSGTAPGNEEAPVSVTNKSYIDIEGFLLKDCTGNSVYALSGVSVSNSDHIRIRKFGVKNGVWSGAKYGGAVEVSDSSYCLLEDVFATGMMRYGLLYIGGSANHHNIMRRCVVRWDYCTTAQPRASIVVYGGNQGTTVSNANILQNCLVIDGNQGSGATFTGGFSVPHETSNTTRYGCISLNNKGFGMHSSEDSLSNSNFNTQCLIWDSSSGMWWRRLSTGAGSGASYSTVKGGDITGSTDYNVTVSSCLVVGGNITLANQANNSTTMVAGDFQYVLVSPVAGKGATINKQMGVSGAVWGDPGYNVLTDTDLWPWPNESNIKSLFSETNNPPVGVDPATNDTRRGFCANGNGLYGGPVTLTSYIWEYLGNACPSNVCNGVPLPPDTTAPSVPVNLAASAVSSTQINVSWSVSTDNVGVTGYRIYRNGVQVSAISVTAYSDTGLTPSTAYSYTVSAYDAAGNASAQGASASATTQADTIANECSPANILCVDDTAGSTQEHATIQAAANAAEPGDTVLVQDGNYAGFQVSASGTQTAPITFRAAGQNAVINTDGVTGDGIRLQNVSYIVVEGFKIQNVSQRCIAARGATATAPMTNNIIRNNTCNSSGTEGFYLSQFKDSVVEQNVISETGASGSPMSHGIYLANGGSDNTIIRGNTISNSGQTQSEGLHMNGDLSVGGDGIISGLLIEGNVIFNGTSKGFSLDGVQDSTIQNNLVYGNASHALRGFRIDGAQGPKNLKIINNTFVAANGGSWAIKLSEDLGGHVIFNNILLGDSANGGSISVSNTAFSSNNNVVVNRFSLDGTAIIGLAQWQSGGRDLNSVLSTASDIFINAAAFDYHLKAGAPAADAGRVSFLTVNAPSTDLSGTMRPQGSDHDIGAYEYLSAPDNIPPTGSISINNGASKTSTTLVTLALSAVDNVSIMGQSSRMQFSNDSVTWSTPERYAVTKSWTLTSGTGIKTVYVKFKDVAGNWSNAVSDTIELYITSPARPRRLRVEP